MRPDTIEFMILICLMEIDYSRNVWTFYKEQITNEASLGKIMPLDRVYTQKSELYFERTNVMEDTHLRTPIGGHPQVVLMLCLHLKKFFVFVKAS